MKRFIYLFVLISSSLGFSQKNQIFAYEVIYVESLNAEGTVSNNLDLMLTFSDEKYRYNKVISPITPEWIKKLPGFKENVLDSFTIGHIASGIQSKVANFCGLGKHIVVDSMPRIEWQLNDKTKRIAGFKCKNATGVYRGRPIEAYYTEEIPIPLGPYKIVGLPGLILYAASTDGDHIFEIRKIQKVIATLSFFEFDENNLQIKTFKEFNDCLQLSNTDMESISKIRALQKIQDYNKLNGSSEETSVTSKTRGYGLELIYEWEIPENDKKKN